MAILMSTISKPISDSLRTQSFEQLTTGERPASEQRKCLPGSSVDPGVTLRSQGEIEAEVCDVIRRYSVEYLGRGPRDVRAYLIGDMLLVRVYGFLTVLEQQIAKRGDEKGVLMLKQIRSQLITLARCEIEAMVHFITGVNVLSLHQDISTVTGEEVIVLTLSQSPLCRPAKRIST